LSFYKAAIQLLPSTLLQCLVNSIASDPTTRRKCSNRGRPSPHELDALRVLNVFHTLLAERLHQDAALEVGHKGMTFFSRLCMFFPHESVDQPERLRPVIHEHFEWYIKSWHTTVDQQNVQFFAVVLSDRPFASGRPSGAADSLFSC
jgi:hypothetical protein